MKTCPRCKQTYTNYPAISRRDNKTLICSACGTDEAMFDWKISQIIKTGIRLDPQRLIDQEKKWLTKEVTQ